MSLPELLVRRWSAQPDAVLAVVTRVMGSTPRDAGAWLWASQSDQVFEGSIGGGSLEYRVLQAIQGRQAPTVLGFNLGPGIDQCCGGFAEVELVCWGDVSFDSGHVVLPSGYLVSLAQPKPVIHVHGAGHVARAFGHFAIAMPWQVEVYEQRAYWRDRWPHPQIGISEQVPATHADIALIMTHSHALDMEWAIKYLDQQTPWVGVIGSTSKAASFRSRLQKHGLQLERFHCPIGIPSANKAPEYVAWSMVNAVLEQLELNEETPV